MKPETTGEKIRLKEGFRLKEEGQRRQDNSPGPTESSELHFLSMPGYIDMQVSLHHLLSLMHMTYQIDPQATASLRELYTIQGQTPNLVPLSCPMQSGGKLHRINASW